MDGTQVQVLNDLLDAGVLTEKEHDAALARVEATPEQTDVVTMLYQLNKAGIIFDDELETFKGRVLNDHLKP